jgi:hypothetical protein
MHQVQGIGDGIEHHPAAAEHAGPLAHRSRGAAGPAADRGRGLLQRSLQRMPLPIREKAFKGVFGHGRTLAQMAGEMARLDVQRTIDRIKINFSYFFSSLSIAVHRWLNLFFLFKRTHNLNERKYEKKSADDRQR